MPGSCDSEGIEKALLKGKRVHRFFLRMRSFCPVEKDEISRLAVEVGCPVRQG